jgi:hypothetical protein
MSHSSCFVVDAKENNHRVANSIASNAQTEAKVGPKTGLTTTKEKMNKSMNRKPNKPLVSNPKVCAPTSNGEVHESGTEVAKPKRTFVKRGIKQSKNEIQSTKFSGNSSDKGPFYISLNSHDMEVCKRTAFQLHSIRQSMIVDLQLVGKINMLAYNADQVLCDQQCKRFLFYEELKKIELAQER